MGRPEPSVLFAQTFAHAHLDEYVDEVIFSEPVIVSACEFLEQSSSSSSPAVTLSGATSPPSFALEVFVHCEGETRFRRLCQPFLYSPSSSNILEVEALVTSHLVVRGSYKSLSLVIYGNTGEDLGQFNIEVDLDTSLTNTVSIVEGNLEDLPPALNPAKSAIEEPISPLKSLTFKPIISSDISVDMKQFLQLAFKILEMPNGGNALNTVVNSLVSSAVMYSTQSLKSLNKEGRLVDREESCFDFSQAKKDLLDTLLTTQNFTENAFFESEGDLVTSKQLVDTLLQHYITFTDSESPIRSHLPQSKLLMVWLSGALLLCSSKESCFNFVNGGGMKQISDIFSKTALSSATTLLLLGVIEQATRYSIGCEGFLNWWPREDDKMPAGTSEGYNQLLKLIMKKQRHDVASLATYILHRLRAYEVACRYEFAVLRVLGGFSSGGKVMSVTMDMLANAKLQLEKLLKIINTSAIVEDPSVIASSSRSLVLGETDGLLSYKSTSKLIASSNCRFSNWDIDSHLLFLLKERGFLPLSAAILSCSTLRSEAGPTMELFMDITSYIQSIILSLVFCRSGLMFLLLDPELSTTVIHALKGSDSRVQESIPLRYASVLISKGFFCRPREVGVVLKTHLRVMNVIDRLITSEPHSEELLWGLWELCCISRSDCGRQALLAIAHFPEVVSVLIAALHSVKELEPVSANSGTSPLNLAIFHSAVEIFEVIVADTTSSSLSAWINRAKDLHKALNSSSPGSNRKDAPTRLLELIDAAVVFHKNGANGLLRYSAFLASGRDAHMASTNILASDENHDMDVDNVVEASGTVIDNMLGKPITESRFPGFTLRDSSVAQLTTAFRILASISENPVVAGALYDEGAVMVVHAVLIDCKLMLEKSSNNYDYLVDEGTECNPTSDILLERNREQSVVDLLVPCLSLLVNLLHKLKDTKEQHRNKKLIKALLHLHRELSPKLAAYAVDLAYPYPDFALRFQAVCHLLVSSLACWPVYNWTPNLFHFLLDSLHATSLLAMGPKETCSLLFLLNDFLPDEGVSLWKNGMPMLSAFRQLAVATLLGPEKEREINWYLQPGHKEKLIGQLTPMLHKISEIVLHCAISALVAIQDMLRIFIVRVACLHADSAAILLRPMILYIDEWLSDPSSLTDTDAYKVHRLLDFLASLLEHPRAKPILLSEGAVQMLSKVLNSSHKLSWCIPACRSISLLSDSRHNTKTLTAEDSSLLLFQLFRLVKFLPVGKELVACLSAFKDLGSSSEGRNGLFSIFSNIQSLYEESDHETSQIIDRKFDLIELNKSPPFLFCLRTLLNSIETEDIPSVITEAIEALLSGALSFCIDKKSLNLKMVDAVKYLFGLPCGINNANNCSEENIKYILKLTSFTTSPQVNKYANSLSQLLQTPNESSKADDVVSNVIDSFTKHPSKIQKVSNFTLDRAEHYNLTTYGDKFTWEVPENLRDKTSQSLRRKLTPLEPPNRRPRPENAPPENSRPSGQFTPPVGPTRRDTFRLRKPNTSRPPSMHVDDYVARERNDGSITNSSNVGPLPRVGSSSGRPPSIHVDEFMARERERTNPVQVAKSETNSEKNETNSDKNKLKIEPDLDDDLQGVDIVFGGEESDPDDNLPFPQPDDNLPQPPPVISENNSPRSIVEETESDHFTNFDEKSQSDFSSRVSVSMPLTREPSISSNFKNNNNPNNLYNNNNYDQQKFQPPLPPMPPPPSVTRDPQMPPGFHVRPQPQPPLPPTPPPLSSLSSYQPPPLMPPMMYNHNRPSMPYNMYGNQVENVLQLARPPQPPPQHLRPPSDRIQMQMVQQQQPGQMYYQTMQQGQSSNFQQMEPPSSSNLQHQDASALSLQHIFSSPQAIQELLGDREKLVQLLEQHPKLMQMLQDKLHG